MNKRQQTVMSMLKPKVKAFGFNQKELKSIAAKIANNLKSEEDASDEDVNAEIEAAIEAVLPILEFGQSYANRVINDSKKNEEKDDDDDPSITPTNKTLRNKERDSDNVPSWAKALIESNNALKVELASIKGEKVADTRKAKLETLLKGTDVFGSRIIKSFAKMKFENDDEFDEFYSEVEADLKTFNQERANAGLGKLGIPTNGGGQQKKDEKPEVLSDEEIKAIASL